MKTRPVIKSDTPKIIKLIGEVWAEYDCVLDLEEDDEYLLAPDDYFRSRGGEFWIVENENEIIATVAVLMSDEQTAELKSLYVREDFRHQGLGKDLTEVVIKFARTKGSNEVLLWSDTRFTKAHRLYERLGFEKISSRNLNDLNNSIEFGFKLKIR